MVDIYSCIIILLIISNESFFLSIIMNYCIFIKYLEKV